MDYPYIASRSCVVLYSRLEIVQIFEQLHFFLFMYGNHNCLEKGYFNYLDKILPIKSIACLSKRINHFLYHCCNFLDLFNHRSFNNLFHYELQPMSSALNRSVCLDLIKVAGDEFLKGSRLKYLQALRDSLAHVYHSMQKGR